MQSTHHDHGIQWLLGSDGNGDTAYQATHLYANDTYNLWCAATFLKSVVYVFFTIIVFYSVIYIEWHFAEEETCVNPFNICPDCIITDGQW